MDYDKTYQIHNEDIVNLTISGNIYDITFIEKRSQGCKIKKLSSDYYMNSEGEVFEFEHKETRADDLDNVKKTFAYARQVINSNCTQPKNLRWLTLTYKENMQDVNQLYVDVKRFIERSRKHFGHFEYIIAIEPQARGAWHCHCILIFSSVAPYMANSMVSDLWGKGFVNIQAVNDVDNLGAYLSAYMADVEVENCESTGKIVEREVEGQKKKFVKGARLKMYPAGMHIFRYSRGIKKPISEVMSYSQALSKIPDHLHKTYVDVCSIVTERSVIYVKKEQYK